MEGCGRGAWGKRSLPHHPLLQQPQPSANSSLQPQPGSLSLIAPGCARTSSRDRCLSLGMSNTASRKGEGREPVGEGGCAHAPLRSRAHAGEAMRLSRFTAIFEGSWTCCNSMSIATNTSRTVQFAAERAAASRPRPPSPPPRTSSMPTRDEDGRVCVNLCGEQGHSSLFTPRGAALAHVHALLGIKGQGRSSLCTPRDAGVWSRESAMKVLLGRTQAPLPRRPLALPLEQPRVLHG